ncbi:hypothetical protein PL81_36555, partial [Streptomyces sp. RSD-27]
EAIPQVKRARAAPTAGAARLSEPRRPARREALGPTRRHAALAALRGSLRRGSARTASGKARQAAPEPLPARTEAHPPGTSPPAGHRRTGRHD